ncbi:hypothetical protein ACQCVK_04080 [Rossellomorea vietnamensis]|uniref:hypothetical protein n=1 Tax=Rossellomorea vietnamensis TaxID=218284 RepID=UPI003CFB26DB
MSESNVKIIKGSHFNIKGYEDVEELTDTPEEIKRIDQEYKKIRGFISPEFSLKVTPNQKVDDAHYSNTLIKHIINNNHQHQTEDEQGVDNGLSTDNNNDTPGLLFNELKTDMREREERTRREITERESRFEKQMEQSLQDSKERELRFQEEIRKISNEAKEREERSRQEAKESEERISKLVTAIDTKVDSSVKHIETMKSQSFWGSVAFFAAMVGVIITLIIAMISYNSSLNDFIIDFDEKVDTIQNIISNTTEPQ